MAEIYLSEVLELHPELIKERRAAEFSNKYDMTASTEENLLKSCQILLSLDKELENFTQRFCGDQGLIRPGSAIYAIEAWTYNKKFARTFFKVYEQGQNDGESLIMMNFSASQAEWLLTVLKE